MKKIQKITVNKNDEASLVVEKIIDSEADEVALSIPRFSKLADSLSNFHLIKREAELLNKKIIIESVDDKTIELAGLAKLEALNPFFIKSRRQFSDIVTNVQKDSKAKITPAHFESARTNVKNRKWRLPKPKIHLPTPSFKKTILVLSIGVAVVIILFSSVRILPKAEIVIVSKKQDWSYNNSVLVDKLAAVPDPLVAKIPGQVLSYSKIFQLSLPASSKKIVEQKSSGKIIIYNAFSSTPQTLLASTRFLAPEGKLFRLVSAVTVPGAQIVDGKIVSSSIEAAVTADKPGESYNIGPVSKFTIPGFKGTPKYEAFYAESKAPMSGGFVGEVRYPSDADLIKAKSGLAQKLDEVLLTDLNAQIPKDFKSIKGAYRVIYSKPVINTSVDSEGNFTISGEGRAELIVFKEADLVAMLLKKIKNELGQDFEIKKFDLSYGEARADFDRDLMSFPVNFKSTAVRHIDTEDLKRKLVNKSENDLKALLFSLPGLESAEVALWPFWVQSAPTNPKRISITID